MESASFALPTVMTKMENGDALGIARVYPFDRPGGRGSG